MPVTLIVRRDRLTSLRCEGGAAAVAAGSSSSNTVAVVHAQQQQQQQQLWVLMATTLCLTAAATATVTALAAYSKRSEADRVGTAEVLSVTLVTVSLATVMTTLMKRSTGRLMQKLLQQR
jgi:hypothetical protein